jgi:mycothiol synthase
MKLYDTTCPDKIATEIPLRKGEAQDKMSNKLTVRNCKPSEAGDAAAYECLKDGSVFEHLLTRPGYHVDQNLFFAEADEVILGFVNVLPELGINRAVLEYAVKPLVNLQSVLTLLLKSSLTRAKQLGAGAAHIGVPSQETEPAMVLATMGFKPVRRFCDMQLNLSDIDLNGVNLVDWEHRYFRDGDEALLSDIQNRCFAGAWGYNPNTAADTAWQLNVRNNSHEDVLLALDEGEVIGYCWTECGLESSGGLPKGRVYMLGVDSRYRARGLGRQLLCVGLWHLKQRGCELVEITVDTENVAAVTLYRSLGFQLCSETVWYEKGLA